MNAKHGSEDSSRLSKDNHASWCVALPFDWSHGTTHFACFSLVHSLSHPATTFDFLSECPSTELSQLVTLYGIGRDGVSSIGAAVKKSNGFGYQTLYVT
jgi:hypothetical protein